MDYKKLYEKQYGEKKLVNEHRRRFFGLRNLFKKYDWDRYYVTNQLVARGERILDVGCGNGYLLFMVEDRFEELFGVEISPSRIQEAKTKAEQLFHSKYSRFKFIETNVDNPLPFPDNFFDVVTCIAVIEHVYDIFSLINEMHRVLKPRGYIVAEVPNIAYCKHRLSILLGRLPVTSSPYNWEDIGWDGGHIHYFTMDKFCWLFESKGFRVRRKSGSGFLAKFRNWWPSFLTGDLIVKAVKK